MSKAKICICFLFSLNACASSSGVYQISENKYRITSTAITSFGGAGAAQNSSIKSANAHCAKIGKRAIVIDSKINSQITQGDSDITFECVD